jgi:hypothetical protein
VRENLTAQTINSYLDTPGGVMLCAQYGSRQAAASALADADQANRAWRRVRAAAKAENYPDAYPSVDDAMRSVGDPTGGYGAQLSGSVDQIVSAVRRVDPSRGVRNLGEVPQDGVPASAFMQDDKGHLTPADTRPPWRRD